jgi:hypothetical protein
MKIKRLLSTVVAVAFMMSVGLTSVVSHAAEEPFSDYAHATMKKLDKLYIQYIDKNIDRGTAEKAKREYFILARELLHKMNDKFDKIEAEGSNKLSIEDTYISIHVITMMVDMMAHDYQADWEYPYE